MSYRFSYLLAFLLATNANASGVGIPEAPECSEEEMQAYRNESRISKDDYADLELQVIMAFAQPGGSSAKSKADNAVAVCGACAVSTRSPSRVYVRNLDKACYAAVNKFTDENNKANRGFSKLLEVPANVPDRTPMTQEEQTNVLGGAAGAMGGAENMGR